jgi:hypothetical protein
VGYKIKLHVSYFDPGHLPKYIDVFYPILIHIQSLVSVVVVIIAIFE